MRLHLVQAVVAPREEMRQPYHRRPPHSEPTAISVHGEMAQWHVHPAHLRHPQRDIVHPLRRNIEALGYAESLPQIVHQLELGFNRVKILPFGHYEQASTITSFLPQATDVALLFRVVITPVDFTFVFDNHVATII